jgi:hypothetical protein
LFKTFNDSDIYLKTYLLSGRYLNELGDFNQCKNTEGFEYTLAIAHTNPYDVDDTKSIWGLCVKSACNGSEVSPIGLVIQAASVPVGSMPGNQSIEYILPQGELEEYRDDLVLDVWILVGIVTLAAFLGLLGMVVEYTPLGNIKLSHEETNFANIDIPMLQEGDGKSQRQ